MPELSSDNFRIRQMGERIAQNAPVQGGAADICKPAMVNLDERPEAAGLAARMVLTVHDEVVLEAPHAESDAVIALVREVMGSVCTLAVPLKVDRARGRAGLTPRAETARITAGQHGDIPRFGNRIRCTAHGAERRATPARREWAQHPPANVALEGAPHPTPRRPSRVHAGQRVPAAARRLVRGRSACRGAGGDRGLLAAHRSAHVADGPRAADDGVVRGHDRVLLPVLRRVPGPLLRDGERPHRHRPVRHRLQPGEHGHRACSVTQRAHRGALLPQHVRLRRREHRHAHLRRHGDLLHRFRGVGHRRGRADAHRRTDQALVRRRDPPHRPARMEGRARLARSPERLAAALLHRRHGRGRGVGAGRQRLPRFPARRRGRGRHDAALAAGLRRLHGRLDPHDVHVRLRPTGEAVGREVPRGRHVRLALLHAHVPGERPTGHPARLDLRHHVRGARRPGERAAGEDREPHERRRPGAHRSHADAHQHGEPVPRVDESPGLLLAVAFEPAAHGLGRRGLRDLVPAHAHQRLQLRARRPELPGHRHRGLGRRGARPRVVSAALQPRHR
ncbi:MAG: hypothetical protein GEU74_16595, partial [Nitriliruptorales bacterium]|nr:hypothetical protein [Nitriliruptorales bacterium]